MVKKKKSQSVKRSYKLYYFILGVLLILFLLWLIFIKSQTTTPVDNQFIRVRNQIDDSGLNSSVFEPQEIDPKNPIIPNPKKDGTILTPKSIDPTIEKPLDNLTLGFDSDGGLNYFVKGTCIDFVKNYSSQDECADNRYLAELEFLTFENKAGETLSGCFWAELKDCFELGEYGCFDGKCQEIIASDTDIKLEETNPEGYNYLTKGTCTDFSGDYLEYCVSEEILMEYAIVENKCLGLETYCEFGCSDGDCNVYEILEEPETQICEDICSIMTYSGQIVQADTQEKCDKLGELDTLETEFITNCCCFRQVIPENPPEELTCDLYCKSIVSASYFGSVYSSGDCKIGRGTGDALCSSYNGFYFADGDSTCSSTGRCCCFE
jgi:hypothetical protein